MATQTDKGLFHKKTFERALASFSFPDDIESRHEYLRKWILALKSGTLDIIKETSLQGQFLLDVFRACLGYRSIVDGAGWNGKST
jgi:hypothetical protein